MGQATTVLQVLVELLGMNAQVVMTALAVALPLAWWALSKPTARQFTPGTRVALVVGAAGGIGSCTARRLAADGFHVVLADLAEQPLSRLAAEIGASKCTALPTNITDGDAVEQLSREIAQLKLGSTSNSPRLDLVVLAAGAAREGLFDAVPAAAHLQALTVNAGGMVRVLQAVQPLLMATPHAAVITVGSATCHPWAMPEYGGYAMSKAAQRALTETLAIEWRHYGIHVCDVIPPAVDTPFVTEQNTPASIHGHFMTARVSPDSVAAGIVQEALVRTMPVAHLLRVPHCCVCSIQVAMCMFHLMQVCWRWVFSVESFPA